MLVPVHVSPFQGFDFGMFAPSSASLHQGLLMMPALELAAGACGAWHAITHLGARACDAALDNGLFGGLFDFFLGAGTVPDLEVVEGAMEWESSRWRMDAERSLMRRAWVDRSRRFGDDGFAIDV